MTTLILYQRGYDFRKLFALEDFYNQDRPSYYKAIHLGKNYQERLENDLTNWLEYFIKGLACEMEGVKDIITPLSLDTNIDKKINKFVISNRQQTERNRLYSLLCNIQGIPLYLLINRNDKKRTISTETI